MNDKYDLYGKSKNEEKEEPEEPEEQEEQPFLDKSSNSFDFYPISEATQKFDKEVSKSELDYQELAIDEEVDRHNSEEELEKILDELDELIGLNRVKQEVRRLIQYVRVQELRRQRGISNTHPSLHSVFYGSPGTGKTTVARLYGRMLCAMGMLSKGHLIETDRSGLVASYVGQTANKTDEKIKEALGGVLFIDEAYSLSKGDKVEWDYGSEVIEILVKRMEDHRDNLVVIAAGYPEPMAKFISSNEGLRSRFSTYIHFDDFNPSEMLDIFRLFCKREIYDPSDEALELVLTSIDYNHSLRDKSFGNARFVRNLFEVIIKNQAQRVGHTFESPTVEQLRQILPDDIPFITPSDVTPFKKPNP